MSSEQCVDFPASYDSVTKTISAVVCVGAAVAAVAVHTAIVGAILAVVLGLSYAYSPRGYRVSADAIIVKRLIGNVRVPIANLRSIRGVEKDDLRGAVRLWGSGGFFGYFGLFRTTKLGRCTWYATDRKKLIVAIGASKTTVYSPDDTEGFLNAIRARVPALTSETPERSIEAENAAAPNTATPWLVLIMVLLAVTGAFVAILVAVLHHRRGI